MLTRAGRNPPATRRAAAGFSLIELMVTVAVLAVGLSLAAPTLSKQIANYRVRSAAEGVINGLNQARAEAVRRNANVSFTLESGGGAGWAIALVSTAATLQSKASGETPGVTATSSTTSRAVTFTSTGMVDSSGTRLTQVAVASSVADAETRRIDIFGGGLIRVCDPSVATAGDPRKC